MPEQDRNPARPQRLPSKGDGPMIRTTNFDEGKTARHAVVLSEFVGISVPYLMGKV
jgi:hypothetical protein